MNWRKKKLVKTTKVDSIYCLLTILSRFCHEFLVFLFQPVFFYRHEFLICRLFLDHLLFIPPKKRKKKKIQLLYESNMTSHDNKDLVLWNNDFFRDGINAEIQNYTSIRTWRPTFEVHTNLNYFLKFAHWNLNAPFKRANCLM